MVLLNNKTAFVVEALRLEGYDNQSFQAAKRVAEKENARPMKLCLSVGHYIKSLDFKVFPTIFQHVMLIT